MSITQGQTTETESSKMGGDDEGCTLSPGVDNLPRQSPGRQGHIKIQGILTARCPTSITSPRRRYGRCRLQKLEMLEISPFLSYKICSECAIWPLTASDCNERVFHPRWPPPGPHRQPPIAGHQTISHFGLGCRPNTGEDRIRKYLSSVLRNMEAQGGGYF